MAGDMHKYPRLPNGGLDYGWGPTDPNTPRKFGQMPLPGDPRRCRSRNKKKEQCGRWALVGEIYCRFHSRRPKGDTRTSYVKQFYTKRAGPRLKKILEEISDDSGGNPESAMSLAGEIEMARATSIHAMQLFDAAFDESKTKNLDPAKVSDVQHAATAIMREALSFVAGIVEKSAKVRALSDTVVDVERIGFVVAQLVRILQEELPHEIQEAVMDKIKARLEKIALPERKVTIAVS